jgi:hypothetical protein
MPVGPYESFQDCVSAIMRKEDVSRESASAICGKMEKQTREASKVQIVPSEQNDKLYIKTFLIDASISGNAWGVSRQSIVDNIQSFIGKPLVLFKDAKGELDHPPSEANTIAAWSADQEPYRIGTIIDVVRKEQFQQGPYDDQYFAIIEVTDKNAKDILQNTEQTLYVSPGLADLHANLVANKSGQVIAEESNHWIGMHLALVREPAYGIRKAQITASCGGDETKCIAQLRKARLAKENCGFCVKTALLDPIQAHNLDIVNTSQVKSSSSHKSLRLSEDQDNNKNNETQSEQKTTETETKTKTVETNLEKENSQLRQHIATLETKLAETQSLKSELNSRLAALEIESKEAKIEKVLEGKIHDDKLRREKIRLYIGKGLSAQDVEDIYKDVPFVTQKKARLIETTQGRATLGAGSVSEDIEDKKQALESLQLIDGGFA